MRYIIPIGNGSFASAKNGWFCVSNAVTGESLGYYSWIMVGHRIPGYLTGIGPNGGNGSGSDCALSLAQ
jgi:hypothetical protein